MRIQLIRKIHSTYYICEPIISFFETLNGYLCCIFRCNEVFWVVLGMNELWIGGLMNERMSEVYSRSRL